MSAAFSRIGAFDHLVTTAARLTYAPLTELPLESGRSDAGVKILGTVFASRAAAKLLRPGGLITFFSGLAADRPGPGTSVVAALNAGLEDFAQARAVELAPLRVNCVSPGVVVTEGRNFMPEADRNALFANLAATFPARRIGEPHDLAEAALAVMTNAYITGSVLHCNGGGHLS